MKILGGHKWSDFVTTFFGGDETKAKEALVEVEKGQMELELNGVQSKEASAEEMTDEEKKKKEEEAKEEGYSFSKKEYGELMDRLTQLDQRITELSQVSAVKETVESADGAILTEVISLKEFDGKALKAIEVLANRLDSLEGDIPRSLEALRASAAKETVVGQITAEGLKLTAEGQRLKDNAPLDKLAGDSGLTDPLSSFFEGFKLTPVAPQQ